ncbi:hypothetical protein NP233_g7659 [Leucocoprinus birnbaumii]|uniref:Pyrroline-5-carboxylate reductase catalytic N-terminal domain-containing protein n=1 Tax=Leucocoprinus birnbaumii TaxID=56174 RepID=A0AAD5YPR6_9AGAR|nr:hypothetical protein NP233_g7659 [Leucocoprinus birnbaumii]
MPTDESFTLPINVDPNVTPDAPKHAQPTIGLIGMGAMGRMYAKLLSQAGWKKILVCDLPEKYEKLKADFANSPGVQPQTDGHAVSRSSDYIIYSVEAEFIDRVVAQYGPSTKVNAIVAGQTPVGQPLVLIQHRSTKDALTLVENILRPFRSRFVYLTFEEHDSVTANTQAVTHAAFLSMGTAWASTESYPWEQGLYVGGIETAKVNLALRIYSNAWHVYAGLAILNPSARAQIHQYAKSASEMFKLMLSGGSGSLEDRAKFKERVEWARKTVFGERESISEEDDAAVAGETEKAEEDKGTSAPLTRSSRPPILLSATILDRFSLGKSQPPPPLTVPESPTTTSMSLPFSNLEPPPIYRPNSHLSLLAMVDCWAHLNINPYTHLSLAATPIFRLFLGVAEHLFQSPTLLRSAIHSALYDNWHRADDLEFVIAARGWSQCVSFGSFEVYRRRFEETRRFFEPRFEEGGRLGSEMIKAVMETEVKREEEERIRRGL